jgi:hypothetical protein
MKEQIHELKPENITSDVFIIAPTQIDYIARIFAKNFADTMNMRTFAERIYCVARESLHGALKSAHKMGETK